MKALKILLAVLIIVAVSNQKSFSWGGKKTLKELVNYSPIIVVGKVLDVTYQSEKYLGQNDFIFTYVKLSVQTFLKGDSSTRLLTLKIPGGQIGDRVIGGERSFRFSQDEEALLFLNATDKGYYEIFSISGKLSKVTKTDGEYLDCSLLADDEISKYGDGSRIKSEDIINRVKGYITEEGGTSR